MATKALPTIAKTVLPGLAQGVSSALTSLGINKLFGGSIMMQPEMIEYFSSFNIWTPQQLNDMNNAYNQGSPIQMRLTREQEGGFLGALAASIGIPMLINALTGKGLRITKGNGLRVLSPGIANSVSYDQMATSQIKKMSWTTTWEEFPLQQYSIIGNSFVNKPLSTSDLYKLAKELNIQIKVTSRDMIPKDEGMYIINLDDSTGPGTHWVALISDISDKAIYFDSFGLPPTQEIVDVHEEWFHNDSQFQDKRAVLCGYYCLYFLKAMLSGMSYENFLSTLSTKTLIQNEIFISNYFKNL